MTFIYDPKSQTMEKHPIVDEWKDPQIPIIIEKFVSWFKRIEPEIVSVEGLLSNKLSSEPSQLISDLQDAEIWNSRISSLLADANGWLDRASYTLKPSRDEGTELDRRLKLESDVSAVRVARDKLEGLTNALKQRLILGESVLAYFRQFIERTIKNS